MLTVKSDVGLTFCIYLEHFSFRRRKDFTEQDVTPIWLKSAEHLILERIPVFKSHLYNIKWLDLFQLMYKLLMGSASKAPSTFIFINFVLYLVLMQIKKKYVNSISIVYTFFIHVLYRFSGNADERENPAERTSRFQAAEYINGASFFIPVLL